MSLQSSTYFTISFALLYMPSKRFMTKVLFPIAMVLASRANFK